MEDHSRFLLTRKSISYFALYNDHTMKRLCDAMRESDITGEVVNDHCIVDNTISVGGNPCNSA